MSRFFLGGFNMSNKIDDSTVKKVAKLSRLELSDQQIHKFSQQLSSILEYIEKLKQLDTENVEPLAHCLPVQNVLRADEIIPSLGTENALKNAPDRDDQHFLVPRILEEISA